MSVIQVLYTSFQGQLSEELYSFYLSGLPLSLQEKTKTYNRWQDRHAHLFGKLLLKKGLELNNYCNDHLQNIKYSMYGKPFLENNLFFNISHSREFIVCAICNEHIDIGIDIEFKKEIILDSFYRIMSQNEWESIVRADKSFSLDMFYKLWTIKESVIKALGLGLHIPLEDIIINGHSAYYKKNILNIKELILDKNYSCHIAVNKPDVQVVNQRIDFYL